MTERLRASLDELAQEAVPVDLRDRVLRGSRRVRVRRIYAVAGTVVTAAAALLVGFAVRPMVLAPTASEPLNLQSGRIEVDRAPEPDPGELAAATFTVPEFHASECPHGLVTTVHGRVEYPGHPFQSGIEVLGTARVEVDGDGAADLVAVVSCTHQGIPGPTQVLVFSGVASLRPLIGRVVQTGGPIEGIFDVADGGDGSIRVRVGDRRWSEYASAVRQWRVYGWDGGAFVQTGGPTAFPADPPAVELHVGYSAEMYAPGFGRPAQYTLRVAIDNSGPVASSPIVVVLAVPPSLRPVVDGGWTGCVSAGVVPTGQAVAACPASAVGPGSRLELTYRFRMVGRGGDMTVNLLQAPPGVVERDLSDNTVTFSVVG
jgi:hypothetical protein